MNETIKGMNDPKEFVCDYWEYDTLMYVGRNRLQGQVEININGQSIYLDDEKVKTLTSHLCALVKYNELIEA